MIAISHIKFELLPKFIGFTSWKEYIKHNWKEGASIDWTKIDFKENKIYFWYSLPNYNNNYNEIMEIQHKGMLQIFKNLLPYKFPVMDYNKRYIYSNYFITTKEIFMKYMKSAKKLLYLFLLKYPFGSKCPYALPDNNNNNNNNNNNIDELRCVGYLLERYINIWAVHNNITLVYAVDEPSWRLK